MGYTTYEFYTNTYYGDSIEESSFTKWNEIASDKLKVFCGTNLTTDTLATYDIEIQKATCCLADILYKLDYAASNATNPTSGNVKSMSAGGQSVTFGNNDTVITAVLADKRLQDRFMLDSIADYLDGTGLLFMGV